MVKLRDLGPVAQLRAGRLPRRLAQLVFGLFVFGLSIALLIAANLGAMPWDVLHQGLARRLPLSLGTVMVLTGLAVLLLWVPLREKPGVGTVANAVLIGLFTDLWLAVLPDPGALSWSVGYVAFGIVLNGLATALYIGSQLGRGPRDGLMTGLARVTGRSLRLVRTGIEVAVVVVGYALGGVLGWATLAFAVLIGPLVQAFLPHVVVELPERAEAGARAA